MGWPGTSLRPLKTNGANIRTITRFMERLTTPFGTKGRVYVRWYISEETIIY
jgi:hypothetical protein